MSPDCPNCGGPMNLVHIETQTDLQIWQCCRDGELVERHP